MESLYKTKEELSEGLCEYCYETEYGKHAEVYTPSGTHYCEGMYCDSAYENYLEIHEIDERAIEVKNLVVICKKEC